MSFTRNPRKYDVKKNRNNYSYKDIERMYTQAKNIIDASGGNYNKTQKRMLNTIVENIVYTIDHPKFKMNSKTRQYYRLIDWCYNTLNPIQGVDAKQLQEYTL